MTKVKGYALQPDTTVAEQKYVIIPLVEESETGDVGWAEKLK